MARKQVEYANYDHEGHAPDGWSYAHRLDLLHQGRELARALLLPLLLRGLCRPRRGKCPPIEFPSVLPTIVRRRDTAEAQITVERDMDFCHVGVMQLVINRATLE